MSKCKVTYQQLQNLKEFAASSIKELPATPTLNDVVLTYGDRLAWSYLRASLYILGQLGIDTNTVKMELEEKDSFPV